MDLVDALGQLSFEVQGALAEIAGKHDLSLVQTRLLGVLRDREPTMQELGRHLGLDKSSVTGLVLRAQRRGLVIRTASELDRRSAHVIITEDGLRLASAVADEFARWIAANVAAVLAPAEQRELTRLVKKVLSS
ncbi:MarR family transcriptional regulator [Actinoplanes sp. NPDC049596]|uniref:MarR family winged helix-turn-helix transcriptional regulator n=1 Tax=unclassified Actinoplanes TaxID=2626549 RepID=UPI003413A4EF